MAELRSDANYKGQYTVAGTEPDGDTTVCVTMKGMTATEDRIEWGTFRMGTQSPDFPLVVRYADYWTDGVRGRVEAHLIDGRVLPLEFDLPT